MISKRIESVFPFEGPKQSRACEGSNLQLRCRKGKVINILEANYGRTAGKKVCPHASIRDLNCRASKSLNILRARCDGKKSCAVPANNGVFGDPCGGTYKYLEVSYECEYSYCYHCVVHP